MIAVPSNLAATILAAASGLGLGLALSVTVWWLACRLSTRRTARRNFGRQPDAVRRMLGQWQQPDEKLPAWAAAWLGGLSYRLDRAGVRLPVGRYALGLVFASVLGFTVGVVFLRNLPAAVVLGATAFMAPESVVLGRLQARRNRLVDQLGAAVRIFAAEFQDTPQVPRALAQTAARVPAPLGRVFGRASRDLIVGRDQDEVLGRMMTDLDFEYGRMFVQLLRLAAADAAARPLFSRLAVRISSLQALAQKNRAETAQGRWLAIGVNLLTLPVFFLVQTLVPNADYFLKFHPLGRVLVLMVFLSLLVGLIMDRILNEVEA